MHSCKSFATHSPPATPQPPHTSPPTCPSPHSSRHRTHYRAAHTSLPNPKKTTDNEPPSVPDVGYATDEDKTLTVPASSGLLFQATDLNADPMTASLMEAPKHGNVTVATDGSFVFTPDPNWNGVTSFLFGVSDGHATTQAKATINVGEWEAFIWSVSDCTNAPKRLYGCFGAPRGWCLGMHSASPNDPFSELCQKCSALDE